MEEFWTALIYLASYVAVLILVMWNRKREREHCEQMVELFTDISAGHTEHIQSSQKTIQCLADHVALLKMSDQAGPEVKVSLAGGMASRIAHRRKPLEPAETQTVSGLAPEPVRFGSIEGLEFDEQRMI